MRLTPVAAWDGSLPAATVIVAGTVARRRDALRQMTARALGTDPAGLEIVHAVGQPPRLAMPRDSGLHLSSASRDGLAAVAVSRLPLGIDLEPVEPDVEPPWHVLHPAEQVSLRTSAVDARADLFARIWCGKEAYLKAIGEGLAREPQTIRISLLDENAIRIDDGVTGASLLASIGVLSCLERRFVLALVSLGSQERPWTILVPNHQGCGAESRTNEHEGGA